MAEGGSDLIDRERGRIQWFSHQKRYAFISRANGMPDAFALPGEFRHAAEAQGVEDGDIVEFTVDAGVTGPRARDIVTI
jgi:cold shock CspA family protein